MWLAISASLGLSLGIVFPLEAGIATQNITVIGPGSILVENPLALASLYLGGAVTGLGYVLSVVALRRSEIDWRPDAYASWLLVFAGLWTALLVQASRVLSRYPHPSPIRAGVSSHDIVYLTAWAPLVPASVLILLIVSVYIAMRRQTWRPVAALAAVVSAPSLSERVCWPRLSFGRFRDPSLSKDQFLEAQQRIPN